MLAGELGRFVRQDRPARYACIAANAKRKGKANGSQMKARPAA